MSEKQYTLKKKSSRMKITISANKKGDRHYTEKGRVYATAQGVDECEILLDAIHKAFNKTHNIHCDVESTEYNEVLTQIERKEKECLKLK